MQGDLTLDSTDPLLPASISSTLVSTGHGLCRWTCDAVYTHKKKTNTRLETILVFIILLDPTVNTIFGDQVCGGSDIGWNTMVTLIVLQRLLVPFSTCCLSYTMSVLGFSNLRHCEPVRTPPSCTATRQLFEPSP